MSLRWTGGGGDSSRAPDGYWYPDLADLEAVLNHYSPDEPAYLLGHSLGGNVACHYAGVATCSRDVACQP